MDVHSLSAARQGNSDARGLAQLEPAMDPDKKILAEKEVLLFQVIPSKEQTTESSRT